MKENWLRGEGVTDMLMICDRFVEKCRQLIYIYILYMYTIDLSEGFFVHIPSRSICLLVADFLFPSVRNLNTNMIWFLD